MTRRWWWIAVLLFCVLVPFFAVEACGPDFFPDVFVRRLRPDQPKQFVQGKLGVLRRTFPRDSLIVAYRYLNGGQLSDEEQKGYQPITGYSEEPEEPWSPTDAASLPKEPKHLWLEERAKYTTGAAPVNELRRSSQDDGQGGNFTMGYINCTNAAFATAIQTLRARARVWGGTSLELADWLKGQDAVFANCSTGTTMPAAAPGNAPALLRADRAYQIAAAQFYSGNYTAARESFEAIHKDSSSPWHEMAGYLAGRCLVRQAFSVKPAESGSEAASFDKGIMQQARDRFRELLQEKNSPKVARAIHAELNLVRLRTDPAARIGELAEALAGPKSDSEYQQDLKDLTWFLDVKADSLPLREDAYMDTGEDARKGLAENPEAYRAKQFSSGYKKLAELRAMAPLVDWLLTFQSPSEEAHAHALAQYQKHRDLPWLVLALAKASAQDSMAAELVSAAEKVNGGSPASEMVEYHRARLLIGLGKASEARTLLDSVLPRRQGSGDISSLNAFTGLRMRAAGTLEELLKFAPQKIQVRLSESQASLNECLGVMKNPKRQYDCREQKNPLEFSSDAVGFFNVEAPLAVLVDAANSPVLPENLRRSVAIMAWVRSVLLKDDSAAEKLFPLLPAKLQGQSGHGTGFHAVMTIARNPGLRPFLDAGVQRSYSYDFIESYRDNWWCPRWDSPWRESATSKADAPAALLDAAQRSKAIEQVKQIKQQKTAQIYLGNWILDYARQHPEDGDVPEALYLTMRMIRYGCETGYEGWDYESPDVKVLLAQEDEVKKAAAKLLRQRYAASPWTKKAAPFVG